MVVLQTPQAVADWLRGRVTGQLQCDSRHVRPGDAFVAWPGAATDGRRFVAQALQAGAVAALVEQDGVEAFGFADARVAVVPGLKALAGPIASAWHRDPSAGLDMVAITGTNGKTSCAWWTAQLLSALQRPCAVVGTLGIGLPPAGERPSTIVSTGLTTPDPVLLQAKLRGLADAGVQACAIEASSIGIVEGRLNATRLRVAVFTNFTQDHLDFHGSMDAYWAAKAALFDWPGLKAVVVNTDDTRGVTLVDNLAGRGLDLWTVGIDTGATARLFARDIGFTHKGLCLTVGERDTQGRPGSEHRLSLPLVGRYNVSNLLCVLASARALGATTGRCGAGLCGAQPGAWPYAAGADRGRSAPGAGGLCPHTRRVGEGPARPAAAGTCPRRRAVVRDRLRWRPRPDQTPADGCRGRTRSTARRIDQRQPAQRGPAGDPESNARGTVASRCRPCRGRPRHCHCTGGAARRRG